MNKHSDQDWIRLLKQEEPQATAELWRLLFTYGENIARRPCRGDEMWAQDVGCEAALRAFMRIKKRGLYQFNFRGPFRGYCRTIVVREVNRLVKQQLKRQTHPLPPVLPDGSIPSTRKQQEIMIALQPCLEQLSFREKEVIDRLYLQQEMRPQEAADDLGIRRDNVDSAASRGRRKLKKCMKGRGFENSGDVLSE